MTKWANGEVTANLTEDTDEIVSGIWDGAQVTNLYCLNVLESKFCLTHPHFQDPLMSDLWRLWTDSEADRTTIHLQIGIFPIG